MIFSVCISIYINLLKYILFKINETVNIKSLIRNGLEYIIDDNYPLIKEGKVLILGSGGL